MNAVLNHSTSPCAQVRSWVQGELDGVLGRLKSAWRASRRHHLDHGAAQCCGISSDASVSDTEVKEDVRHSHANNQRREAQSQAVTLTAPTLVPAATSQATESTDAASVTVGTVSSSGGVEQEGGASMNSDDRLRTRRERVSYSLPDLFSLVPTEFDARFKAPCWKSETTPHMGGRGRIHNAPPPPRPGYACVPSFFLLGQVKCGTTDLYASLSRHKAVLRTVKEQHWFSREWYKGDRYIAQFSFPVAAASSRENTLIGDGTPDYIWSHLRCLNRQFKYPNNGSVRHSHFRYHLSFVMHHANFILNKYYPYTWSVVHASHTHTHTHTHTSTHIHTYSH